MASDVLANLALVVSRQLTSQVTLYSGPNLTIPIGHRDRGFFTPTKMQVSAELEQSNRNALQSDGDIPSTGWAIGNDTIGATETCTTAVVNDCIYDAGQN